ncbi:hypothetical protein BGZ63DRAFT_142998 [Mariannaea sp. PMI_226]|nr:hypothetical protein BGZ63DRAFT_142998 [Mariannaea sp. PMI_226]
MEIRAGSRSRKYMYLTLELRNLVRYLTTLPPLRKALTSLLDLNLACVTAPPLPCLPAQPVAFSPPILAWPETISSPSQRRRGGTITYFYHLPAGRLQIFVSLLHLFLLLLRRAVLEIPVFCFSSSSSLPPQFLSPASPPFPGDDLYPSAFFP